jgi:hypothetical protein
MPDAKTYSGGCHCGRVRYQATTALAPVMACNCSICSKRGVLWTFIPAEQFSLQQGADVLVDYQFNNKIIHHLFCPICGVGSFSRGQAPDGREMVSVNVRCLDDVDVGALSVTPFDGKSR